MTTATSSNSGGSSKSSASPAAGMGGSLAIDGAAALAAAFDAHGADYQAAFNAYDKMLRPFIDEIQAEAVRNCEMLMPRTEEDIQKRNEWTASRQTSSTSE